jgi:hypothetical protein
MVVGGERRCVLLPAFVKPLSKSLRMRTDSQHSLEALHIIVDGGSDIGKLDLYFKLVQYFRHLGRATTRLNELATHNSSHDVTKDKVIAVIERRPYHSISDGLPKQWDVRSVLDVAACLLS